LHHRAKRAQMKNGLYVQLDERRGSGHHGIPGIEVIGIPVMS